MKSTVLVVFLSTLCCACASPNPIQITRPTSVPEVKLPDALECKQNRDYGSVGFECEGGQEVWVSGVAYPGDPEDNDLSSSISNILRWRKSSGYTFVREGKSMDFLVNGESRPFRRLILEKKRRLFTVFTGWSRLGGEHRSIKCEFDGSVTQQKAQAFCPSMLSKIATYAHERRPSAVTAHGKRVSLPSDCALGDRFIECDFEDSKLSIMWEETKYMSTIGKQLRFTKEDIREMRDEKGWDVSLAQRKRCTFGQDDARCYDFRMSKGAWHRSIFMLNDEVDGRYIYVSCKTYTTNQPTTDLPELCAYFFQFASEPLTSPVQ